MELMDGSERFSVDYYFSEKILKQLGIKASGNIIKTNSEHLKSQISNLQYDLVIIGTVHRYFNTFEAIAEKFNTAVICHNMNFVKASGGQLIKAVFKADTVYRLKLLLKEGLLKKSQVYEKANHLLVLDEGLAKGNCSGLPLFYNKFSNRLQNEVLTIVIPGSVSQKRRDYKMALDLLLKGGDQKMEIVFLGKAEGRELEWIQDFEQQKPKSVSIKYFTEKISQSTFDEYMLKADILWCPIQQETEFFSQKEYYGKTKMSGNIGDAIKYGKLSVFPGHYPSGYRFIVPDEGMVEQFAFLKKEGDFSEFSKKNVSEKLEVQLLKLLNGV